MSEMDDVFHAYSAQGSPWFEMLLNCKKSGGYVSITIQGTYVPVKGRITDLSKTMVSVKNDYSETMILTDRIIRVTIYEV